MIVVVITTKVILLGPLLKTMQPSTCYGVLFLVLAYATFGVYGAHTIFLRALIGYSWFDIETWIDGQVVFLLLSTSHQLSSYAMSLPWLIVELHHLCPLLCGLARVMWREIHDIISLQKLSTPIPHYLTLRLGFYPMLSLSPCLSPPKF